MSQIRGLLLDRTNNSISTGNYDWEWHKKTLQSMIKGFQIFIDFIKQLS